MQSIESRLDCFRILFSCHHLDCTFPADRELHVHDLAGFQFHLAGRLDDQTVMRCLDGEIDLSVAEQVFPLQHA